MYIQAKRLTGDETVVYQNKDVNIIFVEDDDLGPRGVIGDIATILYWNGKLPLILQAMKYMLVGMSQGGFGNMVRIIWWVS